MLLILLIRDHVVKFLITITLYHVGHLKIQLKRLFSNTLTKIIDALLCTRQNIIFDLFLGRIHFWP